MTSRKDGKPKRPGGGVKGKRKALSVAQRKYAKGRAKGMSMSRAAQYAGKTGRAARQRVTGAVWERDPRVKELIKVELEKEMSANEVKASIAAQARGEIPTKVVTGTGGRVEYDVNAATKDVARMHGLFKDGLHLSAPDGGPIKHDFSKLSDEELKKVIADRLAAAGVKDVPSE